MSCCNKWEYISIIIVRCRVRNDRANFSQNIDIQFLDSRGERLKLQMRGWTETWYLVTLIWWVPFSVNWTFPLHLQRHCKGLSTTAAVILENFEISDRLPSFSLVIGCLMSHAAHFSFAAQSSKPFHHPPIHPSGQIYLSLPSIYELIYSSFIPNQYENADLCQDTHWQE